MANVNFGTANAQKIVNLWNADQALADEGSYYVAAREYGSPIAITASVADDLNTASATHATFAPAMSIFNQENPNNPNAKSIYPRYLKLTTTTVQGGPATDWNYALRLDNGNKYASGGTALTPQNVNPMSSNSSVAKIYFGACVATAAPTSAARLVSLGNIATAVSVVMDTYLFHFGDVNTKMDQLKAAAAAKNISIHVPPVVLAPGWTLQLEMWGTSYTTAAQYVVEFAYAERISGL
jgi:hypothetical protein